MRLRAFAGAAGALFVVLGAAVPPATAAGGGELEVLDSATQGMVSGLFESMLSGPLQVLFKPSAQRLALQRQTSERLLQMASKAFENPRESLDKLKKVLERVLLLEEQRLSTYSSMEALKEHMSTGTFTEEEDANNRRQMQRLYFELIHWQQSPPGIAVALVEAAAALVTATAATAIAAVVAAVAAATATAASIATKAAAREVTGVAAVAPAAIEAAAGPSLLQTVPRTRPKPPHQLKTVT
ncbi:hypothetical protein Esti_001259 [Eimeria stiedai]